MDGPVVLRRNGSGVPLPEKDELRPFRERSADWAFGVRSAVGVAMPVVGRRVTDMARFDGEVSTPTLARGVEVIFEGETTRSSSCRSDESREAFDGVGGRESCDETDLAELVAVVGAEGNEG